MLHDDKRNTITAINGKLNLYAKIDKVIKFFDGISAIEHETGLPDMSRLDQAIKTLHEAGDYGVILELADVSFERLRQIKANLAEELNNATL